MVLEMEWTRGGRGGTRGNRRVRSSRIFQKEWGIPPCDECCATASDVWVSGCVPSGAGRSTPEVRVGDLSSVSVSGRRLVRLTSASKQKKVGFLDLPTAGFLRFLFRLLFLLFQSSPDPRGVLWGRSATRDFSSNWL